MKSLSRSLAVVAAVAIGLAWQWNTHSAALVLQQETATPQDPTPSGLIQFEVTLVGTNQAAETTSGALIPTTVLANGEIHTLRTVGDRFAEITITPKLGDEFSIEFAGTTFTRAIPENGFFACIPRAAQGQAQPALMVVGSRPHTEGVYGGGTFPIDPDGHHKKAQIELQYRPDFDEVPKICKFQIRVLEKDVTVNFKGEHASNLKAGDIVNVTISGYSATGRRSGRVVTFDVNGNHEKSASLMNESYGNGYEPYFLISPEYPEGNSSKGKSEVMLKYGPFVDYFEVTWK